jgi:hypothetical protein
MDRQHRVAGIGGTFQIGERDYRLRPLTLGDLAELKAYIVSRRDSPLESLVHGGATDSRRRGDFMQEAVPEARSMRAVTNREFEDYLDSTDGTAHLFWLMARDDCPALDSLAAARACLAEYGNGRLLELQGRLDQATGFLSDVAPLGNSLGQACATMTSARNGHAFIAA